MRGQHLPQTTDSSQMRCFQYRPGVAGEARRVAHWEAPDLGGEMLTSWCGRTFDRTEVEETSEPNKPHQPGKAVPGAPCMPCMLRVIKAVISAEGM